MVTPVKLAPPAPEATLVRMAPRGPLVFLAHKDRLVSEVLRDPRVLVASKVFPELLGSLALTARTESLVCRVPGVYQGLQACEVSVASQESEDHKVPRERPGSEESPAYPVLTAPRVLLVPRDKRVILAPLVLS